ncbi:cell wall metabolism sensor histidine kinase WalK [Clostridium sp. DJ247]|uniref:sensor histidine kinase n=1 Tax=Clostridium sp. DJ247 TaxID=2726188 RepID=UPI00162A97BA|nr:ATP-binding protein [Clostridium sp. DJ247]MBC2581813.1 two-component sensor histidine kinase [Clostridium sp. DJ247]
MYSIRRKLSIILLVCSILATILIALFVNFTINNKFNEYMINIQNRRNDRIVQYFQEVYKRDKQWTKESGVEMEHEAFMSNYCLTLLDANKKLVWTMDPSDIREKDHFTSVNIKNEGVYNTTNFPITYNGNIVGYIGIGQYSSVILSSDDINFKLSINKGIAASIIFTLFIVVIVSLYFSRQFSVPIREVSDISVKLSRGDYNSRTDVDTDILELEKLKISINTLGEKLKQQDLLRRRLVSDISHEIRTPLNILQNNLEAMIDGIFPVNTEQLTALNDEVIRFGKLLNNLNILKEFEIENSLVDQENICLEELIASVCDDFSIVSKEKDIKLTYNFKAGESYVILGNKDKLKQVFINILSNAVKFTDQGGNIWVNLTKSKNHIIVSIRDNGIGISKEDLPFIFERLYRGDKSRHKIEGSGIGLTIVKNILMLHSASIDVESEVNQGTTFTINFKRISS